MAKKKSVRTLKDAESVTGEVTNIEGKKVFIEDDKNIIVLLVPEEVAEVLEDHGGDVVTVTRKGDEYEIEEKDDD